MPFVLSPYIVNVVASDGVQKIVDKLADLKLDPPEWKEIGLKLHFTGANLKTTQHYLKTMLYELAVSGIPEKKKYATLEDLKMALANVEDLGTVAEELQLKSGKMLS